MAILDHPLYGTSARGKIKSTITIFERNANLNATDPAQKEWHHFVLINHHYESASAAREAHKNKFRTAVALWKALSAADKTIWSGLAVDMQTGYNVFVKHYIETGEEEPPGVSNLISRGATIYNPAGIPDEALNVIVWRAPFTCTVVKVYGYRVGGTSATLNARRNGTDTFLASALSANSANTWIDGGAVQNTALAAGDKIEIMIGSITGTVTQIAVQIDLTPP